MSDVSQLLTELRAAQTKLVDLDGELATAHDAAGHAYDQIAHVGGSDPGRTLNESLTRVTSERDRIRDLREVFAAQRRVVEVAIARIDEAGGATGATSAPGATPVAADGEQKVEWWQQRRDEGNEFNEARRPVYTARGGVNEVTVHTEEEGRYKYLDSYIHRREIVSRKHTQLAEITERTAFGYLRELDQKYRPGTRIAQTTRNDEKFTAAGQAHVPGRRLDGDMYLEVPVQKQPVPEAVLAEAERLVITIRDVAGNAYKREGTP